MDLSLQHRLIGYYMLVQDEAHTLARTLLPLKALLDTWYILDTGSTDNTPEVIERTMAGKPGKVFHVWSSALQC